MEVGLEITVVMKQTMNNSDSSAPRSQQGRKGSILKSLVRRWACPCFCPDDILCSAQTFVIQPYMVVPDHEPECPAITDWFANPQRHGHSEGSYKQNMTVATVSIELLDQVRCKQKGDTLTAKVWLRILLCVHGGRGRYFFFFFFYVVTHFSTRP